jgi:hypothetical protein
VEKYRLVIYTRGRGNGMTFGLLGDDVGAAHKDAERLISQWSDQGFIRKIFRFIPWTSVDCLEVEEYDDEST